MTLRLAIKSHQTKVAQHDPILIEQALREERPLIIIVLEDGLFVVHWVCNAIYLQQVHAGAEHEHDGQKHVHEVGDVVHCRKDEVDVLR